MEATATKKIRVVVAKPGLDGHDRGAKIIARALRDAGMEVIYTGLHQTPEQIAETVLQEDADAVGLSILSGAHMTLVPRVVELLKQQGADEVIVTVGGTIPAEDIPELKELGVAEVFTPGSPTQDLLPAFVKEALEADEEIDRTGEVYRAEDVHAWMECLAEGVASPRPKPWRK
jgi:methylmalonyl-CoA mutase C-terminal domain/subunit